MPIPRALRMTLKGFGVPADALDAVETIDIAQVQARAAATARDALARLDLAEASLDRIEAKLNALLSGDAQAPASALMTRNDHDE